jgi:hypothetical protein
VRSTAVRWPISRPHNSKSTPVKISGLEIGYI